MGKRIREIKTKIDKTKSYEFSEAVSLLQEFSTVKFKESIDLAIRLGIDPKKSDQVVRGASVLPHGTGKEVRVAVIATPDRHEEAIAAGADKVGFDDIVEEIQAGTIDFDLLIASPDAMPKLGKLGQVLGPRGLMPNPKVGTVTTDITTAVKNAKSGQIRYRVDKNGIIHCTIGRVDFQSQQLKENAAALLEDLKKAKPSSAKGIYLRKMVVSSTMGPGLTVDLASF